MAGKQTLNKPAKLQTNSQAAWTDLRDENGKLCARIDAQRMVLEIRRSDRKQVASFDLRDYLVQLKNINSKAGE